MTETPKITIPEEVFEAAAEHIRSHPAVTDEDAYDMASDAVRAAAPLIVAAAAEDFAAKQRDTLQRLPEYTHGCLAWRVMNDVDTWVADLRGVSGVSADGGEKQA